MTHSHNMMATRRDRLPFWRFVAVFRLLTFAITSSSFVVDSFSLSMVNRGAVIVAGATGYIGKSTVRESVRKGYKTYALVRSLKKVNSEEGKLLYGEFFEKAELVECDVSDPKQLEKVR